MAVDRDSNTNSGKKTPASVRPQSGNNRAALRAAEEKKKKAGAKTDGRGAYYPTSVKPPAPTPASRAPDPSALYRIGQGIGAAGQAIGKFVQDYREVGQPNVDRVNQAIGARASGAAQNLADLSGASNIYKLATTPTRDITGQIAAGMRGEVAPAQVGGRSLAQDIQKLTNPGSVQAPVALGQIPQPQVGLGDDLTAKLNNPALKSPDYSPVPTDQLTRTAAPYTPTNTTPPAPSGGLIPAGPPAPDQSTPAGVYPGTTPTATTDTGTSGRTGDQLRWAISDYAQMQANGIVLTPEQHQDYVAAVMEAAGLGEPIMVVGDGNMLTPMQLAPNKLMQDENLMTRGIRMDLIARILNQGIRNPGGVADIVSSAYGSGGMTIDEIRLVFPYADAEARDLGADWTQDPNFIDGEGKIGLHDNSPNGRSKVPIFSGFYMGNDGKYYPVNAAAIASQKQWWNNSGGGSGGDAAPAPNQPPVIAGQDTPNQNGSYPGQLDQRLT